MFSKRFTIFYVFMAVLFLGPCAPAPRQRIEWNPAKTTHRIETNKNLTLLWEKPFYTEGFGFGVPCFGLDEVVYAFGSESQNDYLNMLAINSSDGSVIWEKESGLHYTHSDSQIFISDGIKIVSLSAATGDENWSIKLPGAQSIVDLIYLDGNIFVRGKGITYYVISPDNGEVLARYISTKRFRKHYPDVRLFPNDYFRPYFIEEDAIFTRGIIKLSVGRVDLFTRTFVWEIDDAISNSTVIGDVLYYISMDDQVKGIDVHTGKNLFANAIQPSIDFLNLEINPQHDGYYVCSDEENKMLYVILGDSRQLMAFLVSD